MENTIQSIQSRMHPAVKHKYIAERYYFLLGKNYSLDTCQKMFHQDLRADKLNEKIILKVLKELVKEQNQMLK